MSSIVESKPINYVGDDRHQSQTIVDRLRNAKSAILIVGGVRHEALWSAFGKLPGSRLGRLRHAASIYDVKSLCDDVRLIDGGAPESDVGEVEMIFYRNAQSFSSVLTFYQTGDVILLVFGQSNVALELINCAGQSRDNITSMEQMLILYIYWGSAQPCPL